MGQKINPIIFRIGSTQQWRSKWFAHKSNYANLLQTDIMIRNYLKETLRDALVNHIDIERSRNNVTINIHSAKPGLIIGRGGDGIEKIKKHISRKYLKQKGNLQLNVQEVRQPNLSAAIVAQGVIADLEKRMPFRRAIKQALGKVQREGAKGVKIQVAGRLNGAEIARTESVADGSLPLHTIRADIDYAKSSADTTYGKIGVKVWIYKGDVFNEDKK